MHGTNCVGYRSNNLSTKLGVRVTSVSRSLYWRSIAKFGSRENKNPYSLTPRSLCLIPRNDAYSHKLRCKLAKAGSPAQLSVGTFRSIIFLLLVHFLLPIRKSNAYLSVRCLENIVYSSVGDDSSNDCRFLRFLRREIIQIKQSYLWPNVQK
ncbi:hypothetical protein TNCV_956901 [Trichonephila clavipes]|nr:hypothetical protein TNCV_956901 [Trichonephila clavipes]